MSWQLWIFCCLALFADGNSGLTIDGCEQGSKDVAEGENLSFTCGTVTGYLTWDVYNSTNHTVYSGSCWSSRGCSGPKNVFSLQRTWSSTDRYSVVLTIQEITRFAADRIRCYNRYQPAVECKLRITVERVAYPVGPVHNCPQQVLEGSSFSCTCTTQKSGNPPARITWDGLYNETLQLTNVTRQSQGAKFTCRLTWGPNGYINKTTFYNLMVAYGPLGVVVKASEASATESEVVSLTCTVNEVYPSATFSWNVSCHNQTDGTNNSICVVNLTQIEHNLVVTCTAQNKDFASLSSSYTYILQIAGITEPHSSGLEESVSGGVIAGVIAAVVGTIIITVITVYIIKRRKETTINGPFLQGAFIFFQSNSTSSSPDPSPHKPPNPPPIQRQAASSGDLYTIASTTTADKVTDDYASVCKMVENDVYKPETNVSFQASADEPEMKTSRESVRPPVHPKPKETPMKTSLDVSGTVYMNVTEVPTDSGLGVYHIVPWAVTSDRTEPVASDTFDPVNSEDDYNLLRSDDRRVPEDAGDSYNHLQLTSSIYVNEHYTS